MPFASRADLRQRRRCPPPRHIPPDGVTYAADILVAAVALADTLFLERNFCLSV
jgi:hypothetical protein